jgi:hypothetical protein
VKAKYHNLLTTGSQVLTAWNTITATGATPAMQAAGIALDNLLKEIKSDAAQQGEPLRGKTLDRDALLQVAANATRVVARLARGHALEHGQADLAEHCDVSATDLARGRLTVRLQRMRQVHTAVGAVVEQLTATGITPELLTELDSAIAAAEAVVNAPRAGIVARRVATQNVRRGCQRLERLLRYTLDPLMERHSANDPDAYVLYQAARLVINRPGEPAQPTPTNAASPAA